MTDPTETHPFTFGCYRATDTPELDQAAASERASSSDAVTDEADPEPTPVTDGGSVLGAACPSCGGDIANVQGVRDCTHCTWTAS